MPLSDVLDTTYTHIAHELRKESMRKSLLKAIVIIVSLLMIVGCPDPVNVQTPVTPDEPANGGSGTPANTVTTVNYTVKHMKQDVSGDGYTEDTSSRQTLSGAPGATTAAQAKSYTGFTALTFSQTTIAADGSTVVTINYNRNVHTVSYSATTSGVTAPAAASYRFGAQVTVEFPTGITAWSGNSTIYTATNHTFSMPDTNLNLSEYSFNPTTMASTLATLPENDADTPYTITLSGTVDLDTITEAISSSDVYVTISLEDCEGLASLPDNAFQNCDNLTSIVIPDTVTSIGTGVFDGCTNIESVTLPGTLNQTSIQNALSSLATNSANSSYDIEITNVTTTTQISDIKTAISNSGKYVDLSLENCTDLTSIPNSAFQNCNKITNIELPDSITTIGNNAFYNCSSLESISIPSSVTSIGNSAFYYCTSLESITIPSSVTSIGSNAFSSCTSLESITIPSSVTSIGNGAFDSCTSLESITIPSSVTSIGISAFMDCSNLETITIPSSVTSIGLNAFAYCTSLETITIPSSVTSIGNDAFRGCSSLESISIPSSVTSIDDSAFYNCSSLESITIPSSVTSIGGNVFGGCTCLESITIPNSVTSIGNNAFNGCTGLESIVIPDSVTSVGTGVFNGCTNIESVTLPGTLNQTSIQNALSSLPTNNAVSSYDIEVTNITTDDKISSLKTALSNSGKYVDLSLENCTGLTSLPNNAFRNCNKVTSISIPSSVTSIGSYAFSSCSALQNISIPSSVTSIGSSAFSSCSALQSITIPSSVTSIGVSAFSSCSALQSITIPSSVTSIGDYSFLDCSALQSITIPSSVTSIGECAFSSCSALQTITFQGTTTQWNSISKGIAWKNNCPATMQIVCTDGTVTP